MSLSPPEPLHPYRGLQLSIDNLAFPGKMNQNEFHLKRLCSHLHMRLYSQMFWKNKAKTKLKAKMTLLTSCFKSIIHLAA